MDVSVYVCFWKGNFEMFLHFFKCNYCMFMMLKASQKSIQRSPNQPARQSVQKWGFLAPTTVIL